MKAHARPGRTLKVQGPTQLSRPFFHAKQASCIAAVGAWSQAHAVLDTLAAAGRLRTPGEEA